MSTRTVPALVALAAVLALPGLAAADPAGSTLLQSRPSGLAAFPAPVVNDSTNSAYASMVSADGCKVAFVSSADGLSTEDDDSLTNAFVRDRCTDSLTLVSRASGPDGGPADGTTYSVSISADGTRVAFVADAPNLAPDSSTSARTYLRELGGARRTISVNPSTAGGAIVSTGSTVAPPINAGGSKVALVTTSNADPADTNGTSDVYVRDIEDAGAGASEVKSLDTGGLAAGGVSAYAMSADGSAVFFVTAAGLAGDDTNASADLYRRQAGVTTLMSRRTGDAGTAAGTVYGAAPSATGSAVAFTTTAALDAADPNTGRDVYLRSGSTTTLISARTSSVSYEAINPAVNGDASLVAFDSAGSNFGPADTNGDHDVYVRDVAAVTTTLASRATGAAGAQSNLLSYRPSRAGERVAFVTQGQNMPGDPDVERVVVRDLDTETTTLVSRPPGDADFVTGIRGGPYPATDEQVSADGRYVVFASSSDLLSDADVNRYSNIFVRDNVTDTTTLVNVPVAGATVSAADHRASYHPVISADGRRVAFITGTRLDPAHDPQVYNDVYVRDLVAATTTLVTRADGADTAALDINGQVETPSINADGTKIAFTTPAQADPANDLNAMRDAYVRDIVANTTRVVSRGSGNAVGIASQRPSVDATGDRIAFATTTSLSADDTNGFVDVYVRDLAGGTTDLISRRSATGAASVLAASGNPSISADGTRVAFQSVASDMTTDPWAGTQQVYLRDTTAGTTVLVSRKASDGAPAGGENADAAISGDGTRVAWTSAGTDIAQGDTDDLRDVFLRDLDAGTTVLVSRGDGLDGPSANANALAPSVNGDGRCVAFVTASTNLVADPLSRDFYQSFRRAVDGECIDESEPTTSAAGPPARTADSTPAITFSSNEPAATFECRIDDAPGWTPCTSPFAPQLSDGAHVVRIRARDAAGNVDQVPEELRFTVDTTGPVVTITGASANDDGVATIVFSAEAGTTFECAFDGGGFAACSSPLTKGGLGAGDHAVKVRGRDDLGNAGPVAERAFTVPAKQAPAPPAPAPPAPPSGGARSGVPAPAATPRLVTRTVRVRKGRATVKLTCATGCRGTLTLKVKKLVVARGKYAAPAGKTVAVRLVLTKAGLKALRKAKRLATKASIGGTLTLRV